MIVLIAPENDVANEIEMLHELFREGLQYYHLRKPHKNYEEHSRYLNQIDEAYHNRIVTHYFHELINDFNLKGIHFQEAKRQEVLSIEDFTQGREAFLEYYASLLDTQHKMLNAKSVSSSFHEPGELEKCGVNFDYHLLSPVFSSISKQGYEGRGFNVNHINKKVIGMGGVTKDNLSKFSELGFKGVGVLGGIWHSKNPLSDFKVMRNYFIKN